MSDVLSVGEVAPDCSATIAEVARGLKAGTLIPYLGPGLLALSGESVPVPVTPETVAVELNRKSPAPGKIRSNMWGVAQFIEQRRHRKTLIAFMADIFARPVMPTALHKALAALEKPMKILDDALAAGGGHLVGGRFTIADLNVCAVAMWLRAAPKEFHAKFPHVGAWILKARERPARQKIDGR